VTRDHGDSRGGGGGGFQETPARGQVLVHGVIVFLNVGFTGGKSMLAPPQVKHSLELAAMSNRRLPYESNAAPIHPIST
jgi:hypothetical protein